MVIKFILKTNTAGLFTNLASTVLDSSVYLLVCLCIDENTDATGCVHFAIRLCFVLSSLFDYHEAVMLYFFSSWVADANIVTQGACRISSAYTGTSFQRYAVCNAVQLFLAKFTP